MKFVPVLSSFVLAVASSALGASDPPIDPHAMDPSVKPGVDFFDYANGGWVATHPIPPEYSRWGSFIELNQRNLNTLREILEACSTSDALVHASPAGARQKLGLFYASGMDLTQVNAEGAKPLQRYFEQIQQLSDASTLARVVASLHLVDADPLFAFTSTVDERDSSTQIGTFSQGGLGLPDRDYYLKADEKTVSLRAAYRAHVAKMFTLLGDNDESANRSADQVLDLETKLAQASKTRVELRDPESNYHKVPAPELEKMSPGFAWGDYFKALGVTDGMIAQVDVQQPEFLQAVSRLVKDIPLEVWKTYLRWHLIEAAAPYLNEEFVTESFDFNSRILTGTTEQLPRWKRVVRATDAALGQLLGQQYVEQTFPPTAKERALRMVLDLKQELRDRLQTLDWMSPGTRKAATDKLDAMGVKIGYPDKWRDYRGLEIKAQPYILNVLAAAEFNSRWELGRIGQPVDPDDWGMTPPTVNAYYSPTRNEIVFPAGILQPPFFYAEADDAVNYGGIGAVIGHEMTHGFDDQGRLYDAKGNLRDWWTPEDGKRFQERGQRIVQQFDGYTPIEGLHINGKMTEGENIADLGGVKIAYAALQKAGERNQTTLDARKEGFTEAQRFFLSYARIWRMVTRPEALRLALATDPHSPAKYRVIGPLSNLPEFAKAFDLPADSQMVRPEDQRVDIW